MINKLTTIHAVISKVARDFGLGDEEIRWQDMIEWISEGLMLIGAYAQFEEKEAIIAIEDYKGVLPCDFHKSIRFMKGCSFGDNLSGPYWELVTKILNDAGYYDPANANGTVNDGNVFNHILDPYSFQKLQLSQYTKCGYWNGFFGNITPNSSLMGNGFTYTGLGDSYNVNFDTVTATFRYGAISLRYLAIPMDESGYPKIPDDASFMEALTWRCASKLAQRGHIFKNQMWNDYERANLYWNKYCMQARGAANAPDNDTMQRIANIWNTLIPDNKQYYQDFRTLGSPSGDRSI